MICPFCKAKMKDNRPCDSCGARPCSIPSCKYYVRISEDNIHWLRCCHCNRYFCHDHSPPEAHRCPSLEHCSFVFEDPFDFTAWFLELSRSNTEEVVEKDLVDEEKLWLKRDENYDIKDWYGFSDRAYLKRQAKSIKLQSRYLSEWDVFLSSGYSIHDLEMEKLRLTRGTEIKFDPVFLLVPDVTLKVVDGVDCILLGYVIRGGVLIWLRVKGRDEWDNNFFPIEPRYEEGRIVPLGILNSWINGTMETEEIQLVGLDTEFAEYEVLNWKGTIFISRPLIEFFQDEGLERLRDWGCMDNLMFKLIQARLGKDGEDTTETRDVLLEERLGKEFEISRRDAKYCIMLKEAGGQPRSYSDWGRFFKLTKSGCYRMLERLEKARAIEIRVTSKGIAINPNY